MATFTYDALDSSGRNVNGKIEADNEQMVLSRLHEQTADAKLRWVRRSHLWLVVSFAVVLLLLIVVAFLPGAPGPGPTQVILVTPTPVPIAKP